MALVDPPKSNIAVGMTAPDFPLPVQSGDRRSFSDMLFSDMQGQTRVLAFFPPGWDPARKEQIAQYNTILSRMPGLDAELLDLSVDGIYRSLGFSDERLQIPFITQNGTQGAVAEMYGVAGRTALFVVDGNGIIRWCYVAPAGAAPDVNEMTAALQSLARPTSRYTVSRREFIAATFAAAFALALPARPAQAQEAAGTPAVETSAASAGTASDPMATPITLSVNGTARTVSVEPRVTLLDALRERLGLTGSKKGCDHGQCGACTVHVDGRRVNACLTLAMACQGKQITTIEGLANGDTLHPMQAAFIEHDGFQCGYCTPGQIMSAVALLREPVGPDDADVREFMSGNICRCGAYPNILAAVQDVRKGTPDASV